MRQLLACSLRISAQNITNQTNALLLSIWSSQAQSVASSFGITAVVANLGLSLSAVDNIINHGSIMSAGNLNLTAGGSIINQTQSAAQALMSAQAITALSGVGNFVTSGLITANTGNINLLASLDRSLTLNNQNGTITALAGQLNIGSREYTPNAIIDVITSGGNLAAQSVNCTSQNGTTDVSVHSTVSRVFGELFGTSLT